MSRGDDTSEATPATPASLLRALRHLLRPLVRLFLAHQITYPVLLRILKAIYLDVGEEEIAQEGGKRTASRLSLLTGIHRKDVRRLSEEADADYAPPATISLGARLVARWSGEAPFLNRDGTPRALPRRSESGGPSFESLVESVSTDIRPRAVLDEWRRLGVITIDEDDRVRLVVDAFVPSQGFDEKAHFFGRNLHDHIAAGAHNLAGEGTPMLERSVYYDGLTDESVQALAELAEEVGMEALQKVNRRAIELQKRDAQRDGNDRRMNFGAWFFRGRKTNEAEDSDDV